MSMGDVFVNVLYSHRRCNSSRMDFMKPSVRIVINSKKLLFFIQRDTVVIPLLQIGVDIHSFDWVIFILHPLSVII